MARGDEIYVVLDREGSGVVEVLSKRPRWDWQTEGQTVLVASVDGGDAAALEPDECDEVVRLFGRGVYVVTNNPEDASNDALWVGSAESAVAALSAYAVEEGFVPYEDAPELRAGVAVLWEKDDEGRARPAGVTAPFTNYAIFAFPIGLTEEDEAAFRRGEEEAREEAAREWGSTHAPTCPVTLGRASLLRDLAADPENVYLLGAVPEYEYGGDQEAELCDCGVVSIANAAVHTMTVLFGLVEERGLCFDVLVREAIEAGEGLPRRAG